MAGTKCDVDGCRRDVRAKGLCHPHLMQLYRYLAAKKRPAKFVRKSTLVTAADRVVRDMHPNATEQYRAGFEDGVAALMTAVRAYEGYEE